MRIYASAALSAFLTILPVTPVLATPGDLDPSFGTGGITLTNVQNGSGGLGYAMAIQSDGKIVMAGSASNGQTYDFAIVRYDIDGRLDTSFDGDGIVTSDTWGYEKYLNAVAIQPDGKILAVGLGDDGTSLSLWIAVRHNIDGSLDAGFGWEGILDLSCCPAAVAIQPDGKIVIAGYYNFLLARYNPDGTLDPSFGESGVVASHSSIYQLRSIALQDDGKIVGAGQLSDGDTPTAAVVRYNPDGSLDSGFGTDGVQTTAINDGVSSAYAVAIQPDLKIVVAIDVDYGANVAIARYNADGSLDAGFDDDGMLLIAFEDYVAGDGNSLAIQADGKIVVAGHSLGDFAVVRYEADGVPDTDFGANGIAVKTIGGRNEAARAVAIQPDGKIVAAGNDYGINDVGSNSAAFALVRYDPDGTIDADFGTDGFIATGPGKSADTAYDMAIQHDGKIAIVGSAWGYYGNSSVIARYRADGTLDPSFDDDGLLILDPGDYGWGFCSIAIQDDDKILVGGGVLARYNGDGTLDPSFGENGVVDEPAYSIVAIQADGKIVTASGTSVVRRHSDGSLDTSFGEGGAITTTLGGVFAMQTDGKVVVAGTVGSWESADFAVARYNENGSIDSNFGVAGSVVTDFEEGRDGVGALAIQADGKLLVAGGSRSDINECYFGCFAMARYNTDGTLDAGFGEGGKVLTFGDGGASDIAIQTDGKIILAGNADMYDSVYSVDAVVTRYNPDGSLDASFGFRTIDLAEGYDSVASIALQSDGKIVWAGDSASLAGWDIAVVRHLVTDCGDGHVEAGEECDDGNMQAGDGCSAGCTVETGWGCKGTQSTCNPIHGDGVIIGDEQCDDGNVDVGDGCSADGEIETGFKCSDEPSTCWWACGDGETDSNEECDDGNTVTGDGCSDLCELQQRCGDANDDGRHTASDAVLILKAAIGLDVICPTWICDVDGQNGPKASDALTVLSLSVGLPMTVQCGDITALVIRLADPVVVAGLNATIDLSDVAGSLTGMGSNVECETLVHGATALFNRPDVATLRVGFVRLEGIEGPTSLARCEFTAIRRVRTSDFAVTVEDAVDLSDNPIVPPPSIEAIPY